MSTEIIIVSFVLFGLISGLLAGMLGIGGGVVTVPFLYYMFLYTGMPPDKVMQVAVSTSLAAAIFSSATATFSQMRKKAIRVSALKWMIPTLLLGSVIGSLSAHFTPSKELRFVFGFIAVLLGVYFCFPRLPNLYIAPAPNRSLALISVVIGVMSTMLGIGGGSLMFPVLMGYQLPAKNASATASASTFFTTCVGSIAYLIIAWHIPELPNTFGYIELPAFAAISIGSMITAPFGVKLSHILPVSIIKQFFGCCLSLVGLSMLFI